MAANVMIKDGMVQMAAFGRIPIWWENGHCDSMQGMNATRVQKLMNLDEAYQLSGINYEVDALPNLFRSSSGDVRVGKGVQIVRTDTQEPLSYASDSYQPIQNRDWFEILRPLIEKGEIAGIFTAGVLHRGEKAWVQAAVSELDLDGQDRALCTLLLTSDHTRAGANKIGWNTTWVVCANTEGFAQNYWARNNKKVMSCTHYGEQSVRSTIDQIKAMLDVSRRGFKDWETVARQLAATKITRDEALLLAIASVYPVTDTFKGWKESPETTKSSLGFWRNRYQSIMREYDHAPGQNMQTRKGTTWGAYNAITSWVDFRNGGERNDADSKIDSMWYGAGKAIKERAAETAIAYMGGAKWGDQTKEIAELVTA